VFLARCSTLNTAARSADAVFKVYCIIASPRIYIDIYMFICVIEDLNYSAASKRFLAPFFQNLFMQILKYTKPYFLFSTEMKLELKEHRLVVFCEKYPEDHIVTWKGRNTRKRMKNECEHPGNLTFSRSIIRMVRPMRMRFTAHILAYKS
jgi:hypothetical protein